MLLAYVYIIMVGGICLFFIGMGDGKCMMEETQIDVVIKWQEEIGRKVLGRR